MGSPDPSMEALLRPLGRIARTLADLGPALADAAPGMAGGVADAALAAIAERLQRMAADKRAGPLCVAQDLATAGRLVAEWRERRYGAVAALLRPDRIRDRLDAVIEDLAGAFDALLTHFAPAELTVAPGEITFGGAHRADGVVAAVVPITAAAHFAIAGLASLSRARNATTLRLVAASDGSAPAEALARLREEATAGRCALVEADAASGITAAINRGLTEAAGDCVVLFNADTIVTDGWLDRLAGAAHGAPDIACALPLSNSGGAAAWPLAGVENPLTSDLALVAAAADRANGKAAITLPAADGALAYLTDAARRAVGPFDAADFADGAYALADWSLRAAATGRRAVAAPGAFVFSLGAAPFAARRRLRQQRARRGLEARHHDAAALFRADALAPARRALDGALLADAARAVARPIVHLIHGWGGGAEVFARTLADRQAADGAAVAIVQISGPSTVRLILPDAYPNLAFDLSRPDDTAAFRAIVAAKGAAILHIHSVIGLDIAPLRALTACFDAYYLSLHDFHLLCPQITLSDWNDRPCAVAPTDVCERCVKAKKPFGPFIAPVAAHRAAYGAVAAGARAIYTPSQAARDLLRRGFGDLPITVVPHDEAREAILAPRPAAKGKARTIVTIGAFSRDKGTPVLEEVMREALARRLPLHFAIAGPARWQNPPPIVTVLGPYDSGSVGGLLKRVRGQIAFLPSVVAETYMFSLSECVRAGLYPVVFDLGAQAERVRALGWGTILPLGTAPAAIADLLAGIAIPPIAPGRVAEWLAEGRRGALDYYGERRESLTAGGRRVPEA